MKRPINIEDQLQEKMPPMRNQFRTELRAQLFEKAEQKFNRSSSFNSFFNFLFNNMKRYSFVYLTMMFIAIFSLTSFLKNPLSAQEVLANALENYNETGDIYHEKVAYYSYDHDGNLIDSDIQEDYYGQNENFLRLMKDINTEELMSVHLELKDSLGVIEMYDNPENVAMVDSYEVGGAEENEGQQWWGLKEKNKIYCVQNVENSEKIGKAFLMFSHDNPNLYQVGGSVDPKVQFSDSSMDLNAMLQLKNADKKEDSVKDFIQKLANENRYNYSLIQENGRDYHLFKLSEEIIGDYIPNTYWFYIDAQTYGLNRYEEYEGDKLIFKKVILTSEYLNSSEYPDLFDPNRFEGLVSGIALEADPVSKFVADGCYDSEMKKIDDSILKNIPTNAQIEWDNLLQSIQGELNDPSSTLEEEGFVTFPYEPMPANGNITQLYSINHPGWDIAYHEDENIYSPKEGIVIEVESEGYNEGYGKNITIAHNINDEQFETFYSHLSQIEVKVGQKVEVGQIIGKIGESGQTNGRYLHFEVRTDGQKIDPSILLEGD